MRGGELDVVASLVATRPYLEVKLLDRANLPDNQVIPTGGKDGSRRRLFKTLLLQGYGKWPNLVVLQVWLQVDVDSQKITLKDRQSAIATMITKVGGKRGDDMSFGNYPCENCGNATLNTTYCEACNRLPEPGRCNCGRVAGHEVRCGFTEERWHTKACIEHCQGKNCLCPGCSGRIHQAPQSFEESAAGYCGCLQCCP